MRIAIATNLQNDEFGHGEFDYKRLDNARHYLDHVIAIYLRLTDRPTLDFVARDHTAVRATRCLSHAALIDNEA